MCSFAVHCHSTDPRSNHYVIGYCLDAFVYRFLCLQVSATCSFFHLIYLQFSLLHLSPGRTNDFVFGNKICMSLDLA